MKFKILAKVVARKEKFVVDCKFWKARGHYASDVNPKIFYVRKGLCMIVSDVQFQTK